MVWTLVRLCLDDQEAIMAGIFGWSCLPGEDGIHQD